VFDVPEVGPASASASCYDAWFPRCTANLAWMGAEVIINPTRRPPATGPGTRVGRANPIVNQVFVISVNQPPRSGLGAAHRDPEGR